MSTTVKLRDKIRAARTRLTRRGPLASVRYKDQSLTASARIPFTSRAAVTRLETPYGQVAGHCRQDRVWGYEPREPRPARTGGRARG